MICEDAFLALKKAGEKRMRMVEVANHNNVANLTQARQNATLRNEQKKIIFKSKIMKINDNTNFVQRSVIQ